MYRDIEIIGHNGRHHFFTVSARPEESPSEWWVQIQSMYDPAYKKDVDIDKMNDEHRELLIEYVESRLDEHRESLFSIFNNSIGYER